MKKTLYLLVLLATVGTASCAAKPVNPLIGTWKLDAGESANCRTPYVFAEKTLTSPDPWGKTRAIPVTYVFSGPETYPYIVYVMTDAGVANHVTYRFTSHDTMVEDTPWPCKYTRG